MRKLALTSALAASLALFAAPGAAPRADAAPFSNAINLLETLLLQFEQTELTQQQVDAIAAARAVFEKKDSNSFSTDWKNLSKADKILRKAFEGDQAKLDQLDGQVIAIEVLGGLALPNQANLAALGGGLGAVVKVSQTVAKKVKARDIDKNEAPGELADFRKNRAKYFTKSFELYKYCESVIRKYGS